MTNKLAEMRKGYIDFKYQNTKRVLRHFKMAVIALFLVAFIADGNAAIREFKVREEFAVRENIMHTQLAPVLQNSNVSVTWEQLTTEVNRLTAESLK